MSQVAPWHVVSSWTRDWTHVPWIGRQIHNHQTTREVQAVFLECRFHGLPLLRTLQWRSKPCRGEQSLPGAQWLAPSASPTWFSPPYIFPVTLAFPQGCQFTLVGGGVFALALPSTWDAHVPHMAHSLSLPRILSRSSSQWSHPRPMDLKP